MGTSSSDFIPKERLSAYQRWELASLEDLATEQAAAQSHSTPAGPAQAVDLQSVRDEAHAQGHAAGYEAGLADAADARVRVAALLDTIAEHAGDHQQKLFDEVLELSIALAQQMVAGTLAVRQDVILPIVGEALKQLPQASQRVRIHLNPADVDLVREFLAADAATARCQLTADASILAGGCRIETEHCEIDATLPSRWRRIVSSLGIDREWLDPA